MFDGGAEGLTRDDILDNITLYWLTNTAVSSGRLYWENNSAFFAPKGITIPVAVSVFPDEIYPAPQSWAEKAYPNLIHYKKRDKGGHFAAWEQPKLFVEELRAGFRSLRTQAIVRRDARKRARHPPPPPDGGNDWGKCSRRAMRRPQARFTVRRVYRNSVAHRGSMEIDLQPPDDHAKETIMTNRNRTPSFGQAPGTRQAAGSTIDPPLHLPRPDAELDDLRRRIRRRAGPRRRPSRITSQGVQLATMQELAHYWATDYDWRKCEAQLNALPQFITEIDGLDIHFIHVRSKHQNALPVIVTHGWPGSIIEQLKIIDPLTNPTAHGGTRGGRVRRRDPVDAGLRLLRQADGDRLGSRPHRARVDRADEAPRLHAVRRAGRRLGNAHHRADGAAGAAGAARHPHQHAGHDPARHREGACGRRARRPPVSPPTRSTRTSSSPSSTSNGLGYAQRDGAPPADALRARRFTGRPRGLDARPRRGSSYALIARVFDGQPEGLTRDDILDNITLYWLTNTAVSSARLYWESKLALLRPEGRHHPGRRERLPRRDLHGAAELDGDGVSRS